MAAAREALPLTLLHWGLHAWAIYAVVGLSIAYFSFRHGLPVAIRSSLYPLLGNRIRGWMGHAVDTFAVIGTMFGVATSLGFGAMQVNAGLTHVFGLPNNLLVQVILIAAVTGLATISVASGLGKGIRRLSELNIILAMVLLVFVLFAGPTEFLMQALVQNIGAYLGDLVAHTFNLYAYQPSEWIGDWTLFYWGWWISWAPFVGVFIARVSRGRTIREFVVGVLGVPTLLAAIWFTTFGNTAIYLDQQMGGAISRAVEEDVPTALFVFFEQLPLSTIISVVATLMVIVFFVTSADSGALVIGMITSGVATPPLWSRILWAVSGGCVAATLLAAGGLPALQTAAIASGLPFAVIMLFICFGLLRGLQADVIRAGVPRMRPLPSIAAGMPWQQRVKQILSFPSRKQAERYVSDVAEPALRKVAEEIRRAGGLETTVEARPSVCALAVSHGQGKAFTYEVRAERHRRPQFGLTEAGFEADDEYYRLAVYVLNEPQHYDLMGLTEAQVISDVLAQYDSHVSGMSRRSG